MLNDADFRTVASLSQRLAAYWRDVDFNRAVDAHRFFTEDGVYATGFRRLVGREAIRAFYRQRGELGPRVSLHLVHNLCVEPIGVGEARCRWILSTHAADGTPVLPASPPVLLANVEDHCVLADDGQWYFRSREIAPRFKA